MQWNELRAGDRVWVYDATWGTGIGRIDDISHDQELLGSSSSRPCAD
ncbi:hypothetical protein [Arthrobacter sp. StoSoilB22]|nr:hypothetical protein [Arthrobacter sp. StoSoilB22]